jgi:Outer membrane protein beta-barrel domain
MKIKYIFLISLFCFFTNAQTEKGNFVISGNVGLNYTNIKTTADNMNDNNVNSFSIGPSVSYFVVNNLYLGVIGSYGSNSQSSNNNLTIEGTSFLIGPQAGYLFKTKGRAKPFIAGSYGYASSTRTFETIIYDPIISDRNTTDTFSGRYFSFSTGVALFINKQVSFNLGAELSAVTLNKNSNSSQNYGNSGIGLGFGFSIYL